MLLISLLAVGWFGIVLVVVACCRSAARADRDGWFGDTATSSRLQVERLHVETPPVSSYTAMAPRPARPARRSATSGVS